MANVNVPFDEVNCRWRGQEEIEGKGGKIYNTAELFLRVYDKMEDAW